MSNFDKFGNPIDPETLDALEIVRLLEEMNNSDCCLYGTSIIKWAVEIMYYDESKVISMNDDLLLCLRDASAKKWKP